MFGQVQNFYEPLVFEAVRAQLGDESGMTPELLEDVACLALNNLPPRYVRNSVDLFSHLSEEEDLAFRGEVEQAIFKAVDTIRRRHDGER